MAKRRKKKKKGLEAKDWLEIVAGTAVAGTAAYLAVKGLAWLFAVNDAIEFWRCPNCRGILNRKHLSCPHCGVLLRWPNPGTKGLEIKEHFRFKSLVVRCAIVFFLVCLGVRVFISYYPPVKYDSLCSVLDPIFWGSIGAFVGVLSDRAVASREK